MKLSFNHEQQALTHYRHRLKLKLFNTLKLNWIVCQQKTKLLGQRNKNKKKPKSKLKYQKFMKEEVGEELTKHHHLQTRSYAMDGSFSDEEDDDYGESSNYGVLNTSSIILSEMMIENLESKLNDHNENSFASKIPHPVFKYEPWREKRGELAGWMDNNKMDGRKVGYSDKEVELVKKMWGKWRLKLMNLKLEKFLWKRAEKQFQSWMKKKAFRGLIENVQKKKRGRKNAKNSDNLIMKKSKMSVNSSNRYKKMEIFINPKNKKKRSILDKNKNERRHRKAEVDELVLMLLRKKQYRIKKAFFEYLKKKNSLRKKKWIVLNRVVLGYKRRFFYKMWRNEKIVIRVEEIRREKEERKKMLAEKEKLERIKKEEEERRKKKLLNKLRTEKIQKMKIKYYLFMRIKKRRIFLKMVRKYKENRMKRIIGKYYTDGLRRKGLMGLKKNWEIEKEKKMMKKREEEKKKEEEERMRIKEEKKKKEEEERKKKERKKRREEERKRKKEEEEDRKRMESELKKTNGYRILEDLKKERKSREIKREKQIEIEIKMRKKRLKEEREKDEEEENRIRKRLEEVRRNLGISSEKKKAKEDNSKIKKSNNNNNEYIKSRVKEPVLSSPKHKEEEEEKETIIYSKTEEKRSQSEIIEQEYEYSYQEKKKKKDDDERIKQEQSEYILGYDEYNEESSVDYSALEAVLAGGGDDDDDDEKVEANLETKGGFFVSPYDGLEMGRERNRERPKLHRRK